METLLLVIIGILLLMIFALLAKVYFLHKSTQEIADAFRDRLAADTNTLIDTSTRDPYMRKLATEINIQLRLLRKERHRYSKGDLELKEAVTNISHDLRTPLTAICGYLHLLRQEEQSEAVTCYLSVIQNRVDMLVELMEELFRYSMVTATQALQPERMDVVRVLEESLISFYAEFEEKGIVPQIDLPGEPVYCDADAGAVRRVFSNILGNVLKYSAGDLSVKMDMDGTVTFANDAPNLNAVTVGRLFDRFYTVEANQKATGLGLSIAKTLIERMGGSISADYIEGRLRIKVNLTA